MAGVQRSVEWTRTGLWCPKCRATAAPLFSSFFECAFVRRVKRRMPLRREVLALDVRSRQAPSTGKPKIGVFSVPVTFPEAVASRSDWLGLVRFI